MSDFSKLAVIGTTLGRGPKSSQALPISLLFDAVPLPVEFDAAMEQADATFNDMQAIWVENYLNPAPLFISVIGSRQTISVPSFSNGMFPLIVPGVPKFIARTATPSITINMILLNVPQPYFVHSVT